MNSHAFIAWRGMLSIIPDTALCMETSDSRLGCVISLKICGLLWRISTANIRSKLENTCQISTVETYAGDTVVHYPKGIWHILRHWQVVTGKTLQRAMVLIGPPLGRWDETNCTPAGMQGVLWYLDIEKVAEKSQKIYSWPTWFVVCGRYPSVCKDQSQRTAKHKTIGHFEIELHLIRLFAGGGRSSSWRRSCQVAGFVYLYFIH